MENLKIRVNSADESKEAQELFLEYGATGNICLDQSIRYVCTFNGVLTQYDFLPSVEFKQITLPELREMVNPMKEYLEKHPNGMYSLVLRGDLCKESDILIPEGAIRARFYPRVPDGLEFENSTRQWWHDENNEWISYENYSNTLEHSRVVWQREKDEPFLTPESVLEERKIPEIYGNVRVNPSFNDQYAEIEQVRQHKKQERNSSAWDTQVGGNHYKKFKIQPMQFALENRLDAAQQNVIKYIMRHSFKNGKQDLEKAKHYIDLMIEFYYGDNNNG